MTHRILCLATLFLALYGWPLEVRAEATASLRASLREVVR